MVIIDNKRSSSGGANQNSTNLVPSTNSAEWDNASWGAMDLLSNGFKMRLTIPIKILAELIFTRQ